MTAKTLEQSLSQSKKRTALVRSAAGGDLVDVVATVPPITPERLFIPTFKRAWNAIFSPLSKLSDFWFKGGRSSFKSSFIAFVIVIGMMSDARRANAARKKGDPKWKRFLTHAVIYRKYGVDIHDSTYQTIKWAVEEVLGYGSLWYFAKSGRKAVFLPTGQQILFRGLDDAQKSKSIKAPFGWFKYLWFEELTEYKGIEEIRSVQQSVQRGGHKFFTFCSYNPPATHTEWVNEWSLKDIEGRAVFHSTFLDAAKYAPHWLGAKFFNDARNLLKIDERAFRHEYLGEITGTGAEVFTRVHCRTIDPKEIEGLTCIRHGLDFGFENDPCALMSCAFDAKKKVLYITDEWVKHGQFEEAIYAEIVRRGLTNKLITADSAEAKAIMRLNTLGARRVTKCYKAPNYVEDGLHWLRSLNAIIIDINKCPVACAEFTKYEFKRTAKGDLTNQYVDANNHTIDAVRYAMETEIRYGDSLAKWGMG